MTRPIRTSFQKLDHILPGIKRVDIVFDVYKESSLKVEAQSKRGKGIRTLFCARTICGNGWHKALMIKANGSHRGEVDIAISVVNS